MELFDNVNRIVRDDLIETIKKGDKVSVAAACFSMYAYNELKNQLKDIDEFRFIFTSPTFVTDKLWRNIIIYIIGGSWSCSIGISAGI